MRAAISSTAGRTRLPPLVWMYLPIVGINWTCDSTWRSNSRSTFSRSSRIGSKICASASGDLASFSTKNTAKTLSRPEERVEVGGRPLPHCGGLNAVQSGQCLGDARDKGRLVPLAAMRGRREKRAVGFDERAIHRHAARGLTELRGPREGDDARPRDVETQVEAGARQGRPAREAVQHAAQSLRLAQDSKRVFVGLACVDDDGEIELARQDDLHAEHLLLNVPRREVVVVVEADLADRAGAGRLLHLAADDVRGAPGTVAEG